jgi:hypothetical protein
MLMPVKLVAEEEIKVGKASVIEGPSPTTSFAAVFRQQPTKNGPPTVMSGTMLHWKFLREDAACAVAQVPFWRPGIKL